MAETAERIDGANVLSTSSTATLLRRPRRTRQWPTRTRCGSTRTRRGARACRCGLPATGSRPTRCSASSSSQLGPTLTTDPRGVVGGQRLAFQHP